MKKMSDFSSQFWAIVSGISALISIMVTLYNPISEYFTEKRMILSAELGDKDMQYQLANKYFVAGEEKLALKWGLEAAEHGHIGAQADLATHYFNNRNYVKAFELSKNAASLGNAHAQYLLGCIYFSGLGGVNVDYTIAIKYFEQAANQNHHKALLELANCYMYGLGVKTDVNKAIALMLKARL